LKKKFEHFVRRTSNFFESYEKEKHFGIYLIFVKFSVFRKKMNFPGGPMIEHKIGTIARVGGFPIGPVGNHQNDWAQNWEYH
jgi:hypothetical protein